MSNCEFVTAIALSPNFTKGRNGHTIDTITIHCVVGQVNLAYAKNLFMDPARQASSNYVVTKDGEIVLKVDEANRAWTTGGSYKTGTIHNGCTLNETGRDNDFHAVTIEVASDNVAPYAITDKALQATIRLVADIAKRNNIGTLKWSNDPKLIGKPDQQNMTVHRWFDARSCPGDYIMSKMNYIVSEANKINEGLFNYNKENSNEELFNYNKEVVSKKLYRPQVGAYKVKANADAMEAKLKKDGFKTFVTKVGDLYKVQTGAYTDKKNADTEMAKLKAKKYSAYLAYY